MLPRINEIGGELPSQQNVKCVPQEAHDWPEDKEMATADFGSFLPGEVKRVTSGPALDRLIKSGEFEITDEDPNSEEVREIAGQAAQDRADAQSDEEPRKASSSKKSSKKAAANAADKE